LFVDLLFLVKQITSWFGPWFLSASAFLPWSFFNLAELRLVAFSLISPVSLVWAVVLPAVLVH
jgi:hypothetical protein